MKSFSNFSLDVQECQKQVLELRDLLAGNAALGEESDILPFFRARPHLAALCGQYESRIVHFDRVAWEFDVFGDFACDLAVGDSRTNSYCFIEFEDAGPRSLFVQQAQKATREWSPRFDHGCSQIIDWYYKLDDRKNSDEHEVRFGKRSIDFTGVLVAGRSQNLQPGELLRLEWRRQHLIVNSRRIICVTFDDLLRDLQRRLEFFTFLSHKPQKSGKKKRRGNPS